MYHPLDTTVCPACVNQQASTPLQSASVKSTSVKSTALNWVPVPPAMLVRNPFETQPGPLLDDADGVSAIAKHQPSRWGQVLQRPGEALSQVIARPATSGTVQQMVLPTLDQATQPLKQLWDGIDFSQPQWTQLAIAALLMSLPTGVSLAAFGAIATPPQPRCNQPQQFRADLAELQCLRQAMQSKDQPTLIRSLNQLQNWSSESPVYSLSQRLLDDWSVVALSLAHQEFESGRWDNAARLVAVIPNSLDLGRQAQERLMLWQKIQEQGEKAHRLALEALEQQDWQTARDHAATLASLGNDYWRQQGIQALPEQIELARQAQQPAAEGEPQLFTSVPPRLPAEGQGRRRSQLALPERSRFTLPPISLKKLTIAGPAPSDPEFSVTA